jgi:type VI secretion system protein ImpL
MRNFLSTSVMKAILYFIGFLLFSALIWFIGPLFSYGNLQPFESSGTRLIVIGFVAVLIIFLLLNLFISLPIVIAACWVFFYSSPLIVIGSNKPFSPTWIRWLIVGSIGFIYSIYLLTQLWRMISEDSVRLQNLLHPFRNKKQSIAHIQVLEIKQKIQQSLRVLQRMRFENRGRNFFSPLIGLFESKRYLYELPWFLLIGSTQSGKTSVCLNSGLTFPVAHQMSDEALQRRSGSYKSTQNVSLWFTNDAIFLDTTGRYVAQSEETVARERQNPQTLNVSANGDIYTQKSDTALNQNLQQLNQLTRNGDAVSAAEWLGFLGILRNERPRTPVNGVILTVDIATLIDASSVQRQQYAEQLRARLVETRSVLGIQFPVYIFFTKLDSLKGFKAFFHGMNRESQDQIWGFTLPWRAKEKKDKSQTQNQSLDQKLLQVHEELSLLSQQLKQSLLDRLQEENDPHRRYQLFGLPEEFSSLSELVKHFLIHLFSDSRYDATVDSNVLRGVYFSSAEQGSKELTVCQTALVSRFQAGLAKTNTTYQQTARNETSNHRSFFIHDIFQKVIFQDKKLVRPNLIWETRFRLLRLFTYTLMFGLFFWLMSGLYASFNNNNNYMQSVIGKLGPVEKTAQDYYKSSNLALLATVMDSLSGIPKSSDFDVDEPPSLYTYGLYTGQNIQTATNNLYDFLSLNYLLPAINKRLEQALRQATEASDDVAIYEALRVYIMLHDRSKYISVEVRNWVLKDYQDQASRTTPSSGKSNSQPTERTLADSFGNKASVVKHIETLFRDDQIVQSSENIKTEIVRRSREILEKKTRTNRIFTRIMNDLTLQSPPPFNILRALGSDASAIFTSNTTTANPQSQLNSTAIQNDFEKGVPGIYSYNGYHNLFKPNYRTMATTLAADDEWVMADQINNPTIKQIKAPLKESADNLVLDSLQEEILYKYLTDYTAQWTSYLESLDTISTASLPHQISVLRTLAEPNSPLVRLARALVAETTVSRKISLKDESEKSYVEQAEQKINDKINTVAKDLGLNQVTKLERSLVDDKFAALRVVVTGQANAPTKSDPGGAGGAANFNGSINNILTLVNEYYAALSVVQATAEAGGIPNSTTEIQTKVAIEASKLPAPLRKILSHINEASTQNLNVAMTTGLLNKAKPQVDRILGLFTQQVLEPCKRTIAGRYPFANSPQEVAIEDFNSFFASGGNADEFFNKYLLPYVDTSVKPWRYKTPNAKIGIATEADVTPADPASAATPANAPTLSAEVLKLLASTGPNPDAFAHMVDIRKAFFAKQGEKRMSWASTLKVIDMDPTIVELTLNIDGQIYRYAHGPIQPWPITWPGARNGSLAEISAQPKIRESSTKQTTGPWALFKLLEAGRITSSASSGQSILAYNFDGRMLQFSLSAPDLITPNSTQLLKRFQCPQ